MIDNKTLATAKALSGGLITEAETDTTGDPANVTDGLFAIARAIEKLAAAIGEANKATGARWEVLIPPPPAPAAPPTRTVPRSAHPEYKR